MVNTPSFGDVDERSTCGGDGLGGSTSELDAG